MPPTPEEIKRITEFHDKGCSQGQIAKELNKGKSTIHRWLEELGLLDGTDAERAGTKKANDRNKTWTRERRLWLNDQFINIICDKIKNNPSVSDLKSLGVTYAIMVDKREILEPPMSFEMEDDGFIDALESKAEEVFSDAQDISVQVDAAKHQAMADSNLVDSCKPNPKP